MNAYIVVITGDPPGQDAYESRIELYGKDEREIRRMMKRLLLRHETVTTVKFLRKVT